MQIEVKEFRDKKAVKALNIATPLDCRELTGALSFKAETVMDAVQLAMLVELWGLYGKPKNKALLDQRVTAVDEFARKHNLSIGKPPRSSKSRSPAT